MNDCLQQPDTLPFRPHAITVRANADDVIGRIESRVKDEIRKIELAQHQLGLFRKLVAEQEKLLVAYRTHSRPAEQTLRRIAKLKGALGL